MITPRATSALKMSAPAMGGVAGVCSTTWISWLKSIVSCRTVSRVRKKLPLMKYSLDAAGVPAFGGNVHEPDRQSVGRFRNVPSGDVVVVPCLHLPGAP